MLNTRKVTISTQSDFNPTNVLRDFKFWVSIDSATADAPHTSLMLTMRARLFLKVLQKHITGVKHEVTFIFSRRFRR